MIENHLKHYLKQVNKINRINKIKFTYNKVYIQ